MHGAMVAGSVGRLGRSGLLVYVERVTSCAAYLIALPEQCDETSDFDYRFIGPKKALATSPYADFYTVDLNSLSEANLDFMNDLVDRKNGVLPNEEPIPAAIVDGPVPIPPVAPALRLEVVRMEGLGPANLIAMKVIKHLGEPTKDEAIAELTRQFNLPVAAFEHQIASLVKLGFLRWK